MSARGQAQPATAPAIEAERSISAEKIASALDGRPQGNGFSARCPAHDDTHASLSIGTGPDGKVLVRCHAGCEQKDVIGALRDRGLWPKVNGTRTNIVAEYDYRDAGGNLVFQVCRLEPKSFRQRRPDPAGKDGWIWNLKGVTDPPPYQLPKVRAAVERGDAILIVEGEKDVDTLARLGLAATCNAGGAGKWRDHHSRALAGAPAVYIIPDADEPGRRHARQVAASLKKVADIGAKVVDLPQGKDLTEWVERGGSREQLLVLMDQATAAPGPEPTPDLDIAPAIRDRFEVDDTGVWYQPPPDKNGNPTPRVWVCDRLDITAATRDDDQDNHGHLLEFRDRHGHRHRWAMPLELLEERREYRRVMRRLGLTLNGSRDGQEALHLYLEVFHSQIRAVCVGRVGWHGEAFVLPNETINDTGMERVFLQTLDASVEGYRQAGTIDGWRNNVASLCIGNSRLILAVSMAFASPLLCHTAEESGGIHMRGASSSGKTTAGIVGVSVWGEPSGYETWRATANALEGVAQHHNDNLLVLDELKQLDPREAGETAYMLAQGQGKRRGQRAGGTQQRLRWRLLFLSTGELSLEQHMREAGKRAYAGQEARLVDVPADAGRGLGLFETLHGHPNGAALATALRTAVEAHHGTAGRAFIQMLCRDIPGAVAAAQALRDAFLEAQVPLQASGQVYRVARRFALIGAAGELATRFGLTGWPEGAAVEAAATCFQSWIAARGGAGDREVRQALEQVRRFFEQHGEARFTPWHSKDGKCARCNGTGEVDFTRYQQAVCFECNGTGTIGPDSSGRLPTRDRAGFRRPTDDGRTEFYVLPESYKADVCAGLDLAFVTRVLLEQKLLIPSDDGKPQRPERLPGMGVKRVYRISATILGRGDHDEQP